MHDDHPAQQARDRHHRADPRPPRRSRDPRQSRGLALHPPDNAVHVQSARLSGGCRGAVPDAPRKGRPALLGGALGRHDSSRSLRPPAAERAGRDYEPHRGPLRVTDRRLVRVRVAAGAGDHGSSDLHHGGTGMATRTSGRRTARYGEPARRVVNAALPARREMSDKPPPWLFLSLLLGVPFAGGWLFYTASVAEDGRTPITDWMDPFLAGATPQPHLVAITP